VLRAAAEEVADKPVLAAALNMLADHLKPSCFSHQARSRELDAWEQFDREYRR
jgi:hypothetical protein